MEENNLSFEKANELLEKTIADMESGKLSLEESMSKYAEACKLLAFCSERLETCKGRITDINQKIEQLSDGGKNER